MTRRPLARARPRGTAAPLLLALALLLPSGAGAGLRAQSAGDVAVPADADTVARRADRARARGDTAAPLRVLEVSDFQCPYCRRYFEQTYRALDSLYVRTGKVRYVWVSFPNPGHDRAWRAIEAAYCAGAAGRFWPMHDVLFERQGEWSNADSLTATFVGYARELGIDGGSFRSCLLKDKPASVIVRDHGQVSGARIRSTPFFLVGDSLSIAGAQPLHRFRSVLDSVLAERGVSPPE